MTAYIELLRPAQWTKNLFVMAPLFFSGQLFNRHLFVLATGVFVAFCLAASAVYCLNDTVDRHSDMQNPYKCRRPVASGAVSVTAAYGIMMLCGMLSIGVAIIVCLFASNVYAIAAIAAYWLLNVGYSFLLKHFAIIDVVCIGLGFVLRVVTGGLVLGIWVSQWIVLMTFLLATFLTLVKRGAELQALDDHASSIRTSMSGYSLPFVHAAITINIAVMLVCYIIYTLSNEVIQRTHSPYLYTTSLWVFCGVMRFLQLFTVFRQGVNPTDTLFSDRILQVYLVCWVVHYAFFIYLFQTV